MMPRLRPRHSRPGERGDVRPTRVVPWRGRRLAELLADGGGQVDEVATQLGRSCAEDGEGLDVCLAELDDTYLAIEDDTAPALVARRVALAWAEAMQRRYNNLTCADPVSGLASIQHVQSQVAALYRAAGDGWLADTDIARTHTLVVVELSGVRDDVQAGFSSLEAALRRDTAAELLQSRMPECSEVAELNPRRLVALARSTHDLHQRLATVVSDLGKRLALSPSAGGCRAWTERLPVSPQSARLLLDELAR